MKIAIRYTYLLLLLLLFSFTSFSQTPWIDSLKNDLATQKTGSDKLQRFIDLSNAFRYSYPDSALVYAEQALAIAEKSKSDTAVFWSITAVTGALYVLGNYTLELDYALKVRELSKKLNTPYTLGYANGLLSDCYYNLSEYDSSLIYWREVVKIAEHTLPGELFSVYGNFSRIFAGIHQYDSALIYAGKSLEIMKQTPLLNKEDDKNKWAKSLIYVALGDAFTGKGEFDSALFYYRVSIPFSEDTRMSLSKMDAYNGIATVYREKNNPDSAIWYAKNGLGEKIAKTYPIGMLKATNLLAEMYELKNNADSSLKYLHITLAVKDSLFNRAKTIAFQNIIFKEKEKQKDIEAATLKLQREYRAYLAVALFIPALVIAFIITRNRRIKQLQNIRNGIADDLHDDIGSALSSIGIMSELAKVKSPEALPLLVSIGESTSVIQENMSDIVWTIKAGNDRFENVLRRMNRFASEILDSKNIELDFTGDASPVTSKLTMEQRKNFYLFFKEVINNAAKHSGAENVFVAIAQKGKHIEMVIKDNGGGFNTKDEFDGNGMSSLKKRAAALNAHFNIESLINKGTTVQLRFKIT